MSLEDKISQDYVSAMKNRDSGRSSTINFLRAQIKNAKIDKRVEKIADEDVISVIKKQVKQRQDSIESFEKGGRAELAEKEKEELSILNGYLPQPMSAEEISNVVRETIAEAGATSRAQMGAVMKALQAKVAGRVDGKALSAEVARQLS